MKRLVEWSQGKILIVLQKILVLLQKKTGEKYKIIPIADTYRNVWGVFLGYWVTSSKKKVFRFNLKLANADQVNFVSIDRFKNGITDEKPLVTLSLEGFGISKIFYALVDFMRVLNAADTLKKESEDDYKKPIREATWTPQPEKTNSGKANLAGLIANFLGENRNWVSAINSGNFDTRKMVKELKQYLQMKYPGIFDYSSSRLLATLQVVMASFDDFGGRTAAANVPIAKVFKGQPEAPVNLPPPPALSAKAQEINDLFSAHRGPEEIYADFQADVENMLDRKTPYSGVIAYGPGGTGKTYQAEKVAQKKGLTEGVGYHLEGSKIGKAEDLMRILYENREVPLFIFDDADSIFGSDAKENILKHALDSADPYIHISDPSLKDSSGEKIEPAKYPIESKYVICTNLGLDAIGKSDAILTRCTSYNFDFTNDEMKELLRARFVALVQELELDGDESLNVQDCEFILDVMQALIDGRKLKRINFRLLKAAIFKYWLAKLQGLDRTKAVVLAIRTSQT